MAKSSKKNRRDNTDPETTRKEILQAALEELAKNGRENLSVSDVARRAGVNRGTAYQHFPTREDLTHATANWVSERMYEEFYGDMDIDHLAEKNEFYPPELALERLSKFAMDNPELSRAWWFDVMTTEGAVTDPFWLEYLKRFQEFVDQGYARKGLDVEVMAFITTASLLLWPIWVEAHFKGAKSDEMRRRFVDEMMRLMMFGSLVPEHHPDLVKRYSKDPEQKT